METTKKSNKLAWIVFIASTALFLFAIYDRWEYLTLIIPFVGTSFVKALDII